VFREFRVDKVRHWGAALDILKKITDLYATHGDKLNYLWWRYLVGWDLLGDYKFSEDFYDDVVDWVGVVHGHGDAWRDELSVGVNWVLNLVDKTFRYNSDLYHSPTEFIKYAGLWAVSGSARGLSGYSVNDLDANHRIKIRPSKHLGALVYSDLELLSMLYDRSIPNYHAFPKRERKKVRGVINGPFSLYLQMRFLSQVLDQYFNNCPLSTLWESRNQRINRRISYVLSYSGWIAIPIDQTLFDHYVDLDSVIFILEQLRDRTAPYVRDEQYLKIFNIVLTRLHGGIVDVQGKTVKIVNGILSGWAWTSMLDTVVNLSQFVAICQAEHIPAWRSLCGQGDDITSLVSCRKDALVILDGYEKRMFKTKKEETKVSGIGTNFLRMSYTSDGYCLGLPIRAIPALITRNPVSEGIQTPVSLIDKYLVLVSRGLDREKCLHLLVFELVNIIHDSALHIRQWLYTPRSVAGGGLTPFLAPNAWLRLETINISRGTIDPLSAAHLKRKFSYISNVSELLGVSRYKAKYSLLPVEAISMRRIRVGELGISRHMVLQSKYVGVYQIGDLIRHKIAIRDWEGIYSMAVDSSRLIFRRLWSHSSRSVLIGWLLDDLPFVCPVLEQDAGWVSDICSDYLDRVWRACSLLDRLRWSHLVGAALRAEIESRGDVPSDTYFSR
jgi:hypothetical protein